MNTLHTFLFLLWVVTVVLVIIIGWKFTQDYAETADRRDYPLWKALFGTAARGLGTILLLAVIVGVPLDLMGL